MSAEQVLLRFRQNSGTDRRGLDYRALFEAAPGPYVVVLADDPEFTIVDVNDAWPQCIGKSREEVVGGSLFEVVSDGPDPTHAATLKNLRASFRRVLATRQSEIMPVQRYDLPRAESEGGGLEERYWRPVNSPVVGADGAVTHILHRVEDITAQRRSEEQLRKATDRLEGAHAAAELGMWTWDVQADHLIADRNLAFFFGIDEQVAGQGTSAELFIRRVHPDDQPIMRERLAEALSQGGTYAVEYRVFSADGTERWVASRGRAKVDAQGRPQWLNGVVLDVTERKRAEEALRQSEERRGQLLQQIAAERKRLEQVFTQAPVAVAVLRGPAMLFELANHYYQFFPGRELVGQPLLDALPEINAEIVAILQRVLDKGEPFVGHEYLMPLDRDRDGVMEDSWFTFVYQPLCEPDGTVSGIVAVAVDVTTHVRARQELERVNRGLEEFAHLASHDLQEPLRMVTSYSQLLIRCLGAEATDEQRQFAGFIRSGVKRMETLIKDLLSYSRTVHTVGEMAMSEASLSEALRHALTEVDIDVAETGATITHDPLPTVRGETTQLAHVFQNLLSNALKYRKPDEPPQVHISARQEEDAWVISVRDRGIGFEQNQAERIFGLFKRLHAQNEYPGTGLGLAICKRIVEHCGGRMWAEGEPGAGATFFLSLKAVQS